MRTFTECLVELLSHSSIVKFNPRLASFLLKLYTSRSSFWNYGLICLVGVVINQICLHFFVSFFQLWVANLFSIMIAWGWNYVNALGKLSKYW